MVWSRVFPNRDEWMLEFSYTSFKCIGTDGSRSQVLPAFTVIDLLSILPSIVSCKDGLYKLSVKIIKDKCSISYEEDFDSISSVLYIGGFNPIIISLYDTISWLAENGYKLNI